MLLRKETKEPESLYHLFFPLLLDALETLTAEWLTVVLPMTHEMLNDKSSVHRMHILFSTSADLIKEY